MGKGRGKRKRVFLFFLISPSVGTIMRWHLTLREGLADVENATGTFADSAAASLPGPMAVTQTWSPVPSATV